MDLLLFETINKYLLSCDQIPNLFTEKNIFNDKTAQCVVHFVFVYIEQRK